MHQKLINNLDIAHCGATESAQFFVVIAGYVIYFGPFCRQGQQFLDDKQMGLGEKTFPKLPNVYDITVQH